MNRAVWVVHPPRAEADALARALDIPPAIARVLVNRKILTEEAAREFLFGGLDKLHDPYLMKDMDKAVARVETAIARGEKILIFGDYDVDGVLSTVMLKKALTDPGRPGRLLHPGAPDRRLRHQGRSRPHPGRARRDPGHQRGLRHQVRRVHRPGPGTGHRRHHHRPSSSRRHAARGGGRARSGPAGFRLSGRGTGRRRCRLQARPGPAREGRPSRRSAPLHEARLDRHGRRRRRAQGREPALRQARPQGAARRRQSRPAQPDRGLRPQGRDDLRGRPRLPPRAPDQRRRPDGQTELAVRLFFSEDPAETLALVQKLDDLNAQRQKTEERIFNEARDRIEDARARQEVQVPRPGQPRLAPRRHRHRRLQAQGRLQPAGHSLPLRGRQGPRLGPEHLRVSR